MYQITPFAISGLLCFLIYTALFFVIISQKRNTTTNFYALVELTTALWGLGAFLIGTIKTPSTAYLIWKIFYCFVIFIPIFFLHVVLLLLNETKKYRTVLLLSYLQGILFSFLSLSGTLYISLKYCFNSIYYIQGNYIYCLSFFLWLALIIFSNAKLLRNYKNEDKNVGMVLILSMPFGFYAGVTNHLPVLGIDLYPWGNFLLPLNGLCITYVILKYEFLNIKLVIKRSIAYSLLIAIITAIYALIIFISEKYIQIALGYKSIFVGMIVAFSVGMVYIPLKNKIQKMIDYYFFKGTPEEIAHENKALKQELAQKEKYKLAAALAGGIAHEIKNPLTALQTFCQSVKERKDDPAFMEKFERITHSELFRIEQLSHELMDFAKPMPPTFESIKIEIIINETLDLIKQQLNTNNITLKLLYEDNSNQTNIYADKNQIKQALLNIILNAIDAMPSGGELKISIHAPRSTKYDIYATIKIADTGHGIAPEDLKQIFEPFYTKKHKGTGLGLTIPQTIINNHKGKILVNSSAGIGSEFIIELPTRAGEIR